MIFYLLRHELLKLFPRLQTISGAGLEIALASQLQQAEVIEHDPVAGSIAKMQPSISIHSMGASPAVLQVESSLRNTLESAEVSERESILIRALSIEQLDRRFALAYSIIFGSQIALLKKINETDGRIEIVDARSFYSGVQELNEVFDLSP